MSAAAGYTHIKLLWKDQFRRVAARHAPLLVLRILSRVEPGFAIARRIQVISREVLHAEKVPSILPT